MWGALLRAVAVAAILSVAGCGGGAADGEGDPASVVPRDALVYAEAVVRPEGSQREDALDAARKILRTEDPEAKLRELLRDGTEDFDYDRDLKPWLGERAGFWASSDADGAGLAVVSATDVEKARESVAASFERDGQTVTERTYGDVDYIVSSEGVAAGAVEDFMAVGREADLKRTVDAAAGDSLAEADAYEDAVDSLEEDPIAHFWMDMRGVFELAAREDPEVDQLRGLVPLDELPPVVGGFAANGERLSVQVSARTNESAGLESLLRGGSSPLVQELPGDSWAALSTADLGRSVSESIDRFGGMLGSVGLRSEVRRELGLDLDRDLLDWIGHTAFFVRGTNPDEVDGGVVIQPTDDDKAADAFGRILGVLQQDLGGPSRPIDIEGADQAFAITSAEIPRPLVFARSSGRVVLTYGEAAAEAALGSDDRLGETDVYDEAEELAGMEPSLLLSVPAVLELAEASGAGSDPDYGTIKPYLEAFSVFAAGVIVDGDEFTARFGAGLR